MVPADNSITTPYGDDKLNSHKKKKASAAVSYAALPGIFRRHPITTKNLSVTNSKKISTINKLKEERLNEMIITDEQAFQTK